MEDLDPLRNADDLWVQSSFDAKSRENVDVPSFCN